MDREPTSMEIEFINHSSLIMSYSGIRLMMDFWQRGTAFDNGWSQLCESKFNYDDFSSITHLWFSHEHPDHFSLPSLKAIPENLRNRVVVLYQSTADKRVVSVCRNLGFKEVVELAPREPLRIGDGIELSCVPYGSRWGAVDSWLLVRTPAQTFLNINDCEIHDVRSAAKVREFAGPIDLLATQFSYASKQGNRSDPSWIGRSRRYHLDKLALKIETLQPAYTLPFASFVYFSHRENRYLNDGIIRVCDAAEVIEARGSTPIVMYPGDRWSMGQPWDNGPPLSSYARRYEWLAARPEEAFPVAAQVPRQQLVAAADEFIGSLTSRATARQVASYLALRHAARAPYRRTLFGRSKLRLVKVIACIRGLYEIGRIFVEDEQQAYELSIARGLYPVDLSREQCQIAIGSEALLYCFSVSWGGETLQVNGRFENISDGWKKLSEIFVLARRLELGFRFPKSIVAAVAFARLH